LGFWARTRTTAAPRARFASEQNNGQAKRESEERRNPSRGKDDCGSRQGQSFF